MKGWKSIVLLLLFTSCGEKPADEKQDTVKADTAIVASTSMYSSLVSSLPELKLPALVDVDIIRNFTPKILTEEQCHALLPGEFDFQSYHTVACTAISHLKDSCTAIWYCLKSDGYYEDSPETIDVVMVIYDAQGKPMDACNVSDETVGYSYSYVRADSLFTVQVDEMENINITTYGVQIGAKGFTPEEAATTTFDPTDEGKKKADQFKRDYLDARK